MKTVVIVGHRAYRYSHSKRIEDAMIKPDASADEARQGIENFRVNGFDEPVDPPAPEPQLPPAGERAFDRVARELLVAPPGCRRCGGRMIPGLAMAATLRGSPDFPGDTGTEAGCTVRGGGPGVLVDCSKCSACGWSVRS